MGNMNDTPKPTAADSYETMEALLCEMQGLRDQLVEVKRERDEARAERDEWIARFRADEQLIKEAMEKHE